MTFVLCLVSLTTLMLGLLELILFAICLQLQGINHPSFYQRVANKNIFLENRTEHCKKKNITPDFNLIVPTNLHY